MKRIATTALAGIIAVGALSSGVASAQSYRSNDRSWHGDRDDRRDYRRGQHRDYNRYDNRNNRWRRGDRLPGNYRSHYREVDWRRHHLRQPPRGYHYVRDDNTGEYLLVGIATGVILSILLSQ